jgi:hypothetical protein
VLFNRIEATVGCFIQLYSCNTWCMLSILNLVRRATLYLGIYSCRMCFIQLYEKIPELCAPVAVACRVT